jgi:GNAT superfamily N-acetyltransferase
LEVVEYDPSRRADVADLMGRVWGARPAEAELEWFYERNPVRPASVLLGAEDGRVVATVAIAFLRMSIAGVAIEVGMPLRVATDPAYQGRGIFRELQAANEERVRGLGIRLLLTVPNDASAPVFVNRLGWTPLPSLRVWARPRLLRLGVRAPRSHLVTRFAGEIVVRPEGPDRVLRDAAWLNWRFVDGPTPYTLLEGAGYGIARQRGRAGVVAAVEGELLRDAGGAAGGLGVIASPPPWQRGLYSRHGYVPTHKSFTVLGKSLHHEQPVPLQPHFELGDLDFF